jgi:hypothetical protein
MLVSIVPAPINTKIELDEATRQSLRERAKELGLFTKNIEKIVNENLLAQLTYLEGIKLIEENHQNFSKENFSAELNCEFEKIKIFKNPCQQQALLEEFPMVIIKQLTDKRLSHFEALKKLRENFEISEISSDEILCSVFEKIKNFKEETLNKFSSAGLLSLTVGLTIPEAQSLTEKQWPVVDYLENLKEEYPEITTEELSQKFAAVKDFTHTCQILASKLGFEKEDAKNFNDYSHWPALGKLEILKADNQKSSIEELQNLLDEDLKREIKDIIAGKPLNHIVNYSDKDSWPKSITSSTSSENLSTQNHKITGNNI